MSGGRGIQQGRTKYYEFRVGVSAGDLINVQKELFIHYLKVGDQTMSTAKPFTNVPPFVNRVEEIRYLKSWMTEMPNSILFLYGPKSSGKTTLIYRFIEQNMSGGGYDIKHFNLRELLLVNYDSFLRAFFEQKSSEQVKEIRQYDLKVFKLSVETLKGLASRELDPFIVMKRELEKSNKKGRRPVIIIDELQALDEIYFNGGRELLNEMFNFFVAMTKESHLCHVIIASSDGYFIERIYQDSKLKKTSEFLEIAYLEKQDVMDWLSRLEDYSKIDQFVLNDGQKEAMWDFFGGSCWEISTFLGDLLNIARDRKIPERDFRELLEKKRGFFCSMFMEYATIEPEKEQLLIKMNELIGDRPGRGFVFADLRSLVDDGIWTVHALKDELTLLVRKNFISYAPPRAEYALQGRTMELGLAAYVKRLAGKAA